MLLNNPYFLDQLIEQCPQDIFLDFLDEPESSPRRNRRGLYGSYLLGTGEKRVKVILIDPRSQLDKEKQAVLGAKQWAWLDMELRTDPTPFTILGTGVITHIARRGGGVTSLLPPQTTLTRLKCQHNVCALYSLSNTV